LRNQFNANYGIVRSLLKDIPRELLLVIKTQALVRSINRDLGAKINRFVIMAQYSIVGLNTTESQPRSLFAKVNSFKELLLFDLMLNIYALSMWMSSIFTKIFLFFGFRSKNEFALM